MPSSQRGPGILLFLLGLVFFVIGIVIAFDEIPLLVSGHVTQGQVIGLVQADRARRRVAIVEYRDLEGGKHTLRTLNPGPQPGDTVEVVFMTANPEHAEDYSPIRQCAAFLLTGGIGSFLMIGGVTLIRRRSSAG